MESGEKEAAILYLAEAMRRHFLFSLQVMKPQAEQYLKNAGFFPKESTHATTPPPAALPIDGDDVDVIGDDAPTGIPAKQVGLPPAGQGDAPTIRGKPSKIPVNTDRHQMSAAAAQKVKEIIRNGEKRDWIKREVEAELKREYRDYLTKDLNDLWRGIPAGYKQGSGNPNNIRKRNLRVTLNDLNLQ